MKENIDLTESMIFSRGNWQFDILGSMINKLMLNEYRFPWNIKTIKSEDDLDLGHQRKSVIVLGDKATRAKIKECRQMDSLDYCDCCGARMNLKPWDRELGVCHKCNEYYGKSFGRCKWRNKRLNETIN